MSPINNQIIFNDRHQHTTTLTTATSTKPQNLRTQPNHQIPLRPDNPNLTAPDRHPILPNNTLLPPTTILTALHNPNLHTHPSPLKRVAINIRQIKPHLILPFDKVIREDSLRRTGIQSVPESRELDAHSAGLRIMVVGFRVVGVLLGGAVAAAAGDGCSCGNGDLRADRG